ncbi:MAG: glycogen debranching enzyme, partial [Jatrophihabitans endophyticus]|nr:glycogen debranching enzyme [Jatrophihabitans endophyticus]
LVFTRKVAALRRDHPVFRRRRFFDGRPTRRGAHLPDIGWFTPDGTEMTEEDWDFAFGRSIAVYLNGQGIAGRDSRGERIVDDSFLLCFCAYWEPVDFALPPSEYANTWEVVVDTMTDGTDEGRTLTAGDKVTVGPRALVVLRRTA